MQRAFSKAIAAALVLASAIPVTREASAFCGFYVSGADAKLFNNATEVVLMREGTRTVLSMQNNYQGPPQNFAMVVPVPVVLQKENVKTLPREIFARVDQLGAPRLVEYWEQDPCAVDATEYKAKGGGLGGLGRGRAVPGPKAEDLGVKVEAEFTVGEYDVVVLSAQDSGGLDTWLKREKYSIPDGSEPYLRPYVQSGSKFFVAKVDISKVKFENGMATLSPLRFHYDADAFSLPIRLGLVNSKGTQDLIVNVLSKGQRYEVANYPNATIPTNFDVAESARGQFGAFYAALFDRTIEKIPKVVVTEYAWDAGTCDPCPSPALNPSELNTLGADVLPSANGADSDGRRRPPGGVTTPGRSPSRRFPSGFVLTRLHARYTKETLGEDLVFRAAAPIAGGREVTGKEGTLEHGSSRAGVNNFQGRYAIRHPWTGAIACSEPRRGRWGGPPAGVTGDTRAKPATNLAFAPRGNVQLASFVKGSLPEVVALASLPPTSETPSSPKEDAGTTVDAGAAADGGSSAASSQKRGCGCQAPGRHASSGWAIFAVAAAGAAAARRRRCEESVRGR